MNLPSGLLGRLGVDYIFAFWSLSLGWITFLHSGLCLWGGLEVDYIFAFLSMGGLFILKTYWGKISQFHQLNYAIGWIKRGLQGIYTFYSTYINYET